MKEKYDAYLMYNYKGDPNYQSYIDGVYPAPNYLNIDIYRRKFYKKYIDKDFDIHYGDEKKPEIKIISRDINWVDKIEILLFGIFLAVLVLGIITQTYYHTMVIASAVIIGLLKECGLPEFSKLYLRDVFINDYFNDLISVCFCAFSFNSSVILWVPLGILALLKIAEFTHILARQHNRLAEVISGVFDYFVINREFYGQLKSQIEIYTGFYLLFVLCFGWMSIVLPLFYWQMLQVRYIINKKTAGAFDELAEQMDYIIAIPSLPVPFKWPFMGLRKLGAYMANMVRQSQESQERASETVPEAEVKKESQPQPEAKVDEKQEVKKEDPQEKKDK